MTAINSCAFLRLSSAGLGGLALLLILAPVHFDYRKIFPAVRDPTEKTLKISVTTIAKLQLDIAPYIADVR